MTFKYFTLDEFACKHTGENKIVPAFVRRLDKLRAACGFHLLSPVAIVTRHTLQRLVSPRAGYIRKAWLLTLPSVTV
jgi:hypothetical protein